MYTKLLYSAGGGIISAARQSVQNSCATIAIGLGGTGISCLRALKKEVYERIKPDRVVDGKAQYDHIKFLGVDSDRWSFGDEGAVDALDPVAECVDISCPNIQALLKDAYLLQQEESLRWLKVAGTQNDGSGISILSAQVNFGGVRQIGRLLLMRSCTAFITNLTGLINSARYTLFGKGEINIHIFTGLSGGTGGGIFLDVCYLVQRVLENQGLCGQANIRGYFFLPDVNLTRTPNLAYIPVNGFAAMKELDYCMNFEQNGGEWDQQYLGFRIKTNKPPVNLAYLISTNGVATGDLYQYAVHTTADYVLQCMTKPYTEDGDEDAYNADRALTEDIAWYMRTLKKQHGACYNYCLLGAATAYIPYREIITYLTARVFEGFAQGGKNIPDRNQVEMLAMNWGMRYEDIWRALNDKMPVVPMYEVDYKELYEQVQGLSVGRVPMICQRMADALDPIHRKLNENAILLLGREDLSEQEGPQTLIGRLKSKMICLAADIDRGPGYAAALLSSAQENSFARKLQEYIAQNQCWLKYAHAELQVNEHNVYQALCDLQNTGLFQNIRRRKCAETYMTAVHALFTQRAKIDMLMTMDKVLTVFYEQVEALHSDFFGIFAGVMWELQETFHANLIVLNDPASTKERYGHCLLSLRDEKLKNTMDRAVSSMDIKRQFRSFVEAMLADPEKWLAREPNRICAFVSEYFMDRVRAFSDKTLDDCLKEKYGTEDPSTLKQKIYSEDLLPLLESSKPLFGFETGGFCFSQSCMIESLLVPYNAQEIFSAAREYVNAGHQIGVGKAYATDRITLFRTAFAVPLFAYEGIDRYAQLYQKKAAASTHIYPEWRNLPDIVPFSCRAEAQHSDAEKAAAALFDRALACGSIGKDVQAGAYTEYRLNRFDLDVMRQMIEQAEALRHGDAGAICAFLATSKDRKPPVLSYRVILRENNPEKSDRVAKDIVIASPEYLSVLKEQTELQNRYETLLLALQADAEEGEKESQAINSFSVALMTGTIKRNGSYSYAYYYLREGREERVSLSEFETEPYGMTLPLYSAYLGYQALWDETKREIDAQVKQNLLEHREQADVYVADINSMVTPEKVNAMIREVKQVYPDLRVKFVRWIKKFTSEVLAFTSMR